MTQEANTIARAFRERKKCNQKRTSCDGDVVELFGSRIAWRDPDNGEIYMTLAGWGTTTTRDRLNAICWAFGGRHRFSQMKFEQYFDDEPISIDQVVPMFGGPLTRQIAALERGESLV